MKSSSKLLTIFCGIQKFSTKDYPGFLSATFFTLGCNLRCRYCYNSNFITFDKQKLIDKKDIIDFLEKRKDILDAIVICGGEPTIHNQSLIDWIKYIKSLGYKIKLDTNGTNPDLIKKIIDDRLVDFIALDFKGLGKKYIEVTQRDLFHKFEQSLDLIISSDINYGIRTTIHSDLFDVKDIYEMKQFLMNRGCKNWALQNCINVDVLDNNLGLHNKSKFDFNYKEYFDSFEIRN